MKYYTQFRISCNEDKDTLLLEIDRVDKEGNVRLTANVPELKEISRVAIGGIIDLIHVLLIKNSKIIVIDNS